MKAIMDDRMKSNKNKSGFEKTVLKNELRIISERVKDTQSFALGIAVSAGSKSDPKKLEGLTHFMEHILFRRTQNHTGKQIVTAFEQIGAYVNAYTTKDHTCFYVRALNTHLEECFNLLSEIVLHPKITEADVKKERGIIIEEIKSYEDDPEEIIFDIGESVIFKGSSLSHPVSGYVESVKRIDAKSLRQFHSDHYVPGNIIISFAGKQAHDEIVDLSKKLKFDFKTGQLTDTETPVTVKPKKIIRKKQYQQSHFLLTRKVDGMESEDRYPLAILNSILGDGMSSRLNQLLRENLGYVYTVYSTISLLKDCGTLSIYAAAEQNKIEKINGIIRKELLKIFRNNLTEKEIARAKEQIKSSTIMVLEGMSSRMQALIKSEISLGRYESIEETIKDIDRITAGQVFRTAKKYLVPDDWSEVRLLSK